MKFLKYTLGGAGGGVVVAANDGVLTNKEDYSSSLSSSSSSSTTSTTMMITTTTTTKTTNTTKRDIDTLSHLGRNVPPQYYGARLERTVAPRHAFLVHMKLPHGPILLDNRGKLLREFLISSRRTKQFCALCNTWRRKYGVYNPSLKNDTNHYHHQHHNDDYHFKKRLNDIKDESLITTTIITPEQIEAFDALFQRGTMSAARNDIEITDHTHHLIPNMMSGRLLQLLIQHGANPYERDVRGASLLHWAAGAGNIDALRVLVDCTASREGGGGLSECVFTKTTRDGATPLHWAAVGVKPKEFGCGGHLEVCRYLIEGCNNGGSDERKRAVNALTKDSNSVLMWSAWSGTLDVVKFLVRHRADPTVENRNGCTVAHWAASGGNLGVCKYLAETVGVDFTTENYAGNTPLSHAVAYGRVDVVKWLREEVCAQDEDGRAAELAWDFVGWSDGDRERKKVFDLFQEWNGEFDEFAKGDEVDNEEFY